ncbi:hypothetical protein [Streptomyces sp. MMG1121]|uniref:hypothetical protein n=1 Tax=Streptomyces sp. MMG1121 TaxID=1415544 RepID=UPI0006AF60AE|nr:hypothetical protein [Streptomyces sp. MMG1121]
MTAPSRRSRTAATGAPSATKGPWRTGPISDALTPKTAVFCSGPLPSPAPPRLPAAWAMTLLALLRIGLTVAWLGAAPPAPARAGPRLHTARPRRALVRATGVVLIGFGLVVTTTDR